MKDIMLFDGGIGQELVKRNLSTKDPLWSARVLLDNFELVKNLHIEFLNSGSTVITTNSYSCTPQRLKRFNLENEFIYPIIKLCLLTSAVKFLIVTWSKFSINWSLKFKAKPIFQSVTKELKSPKLI